MCIHSLDRGGIMGAFAASALATVVRETDRRIVAQDDLMSRRNAVALSEPIDFCHDHFGFPWIRTCTLAEAHSRPGLVTAEASRLGGRSALTASSSCSRGSLSVPRSWPAAEDAARYLKPEMLGRKQ